MLKSDLMIGPEKLNFLTNLNQKGLKDIKYPLRMFVLMQKLLNFICLTMKFNNCHHSSLENIFCHERKQPCYDTLRYTNHKLTVIVSNSDLQLLYMHACLLLHFEKEGREGDFTANIGLSNLTFRSA